METKPTPIQEALRRFDDKFSPMDFAGAEVTQKAVRDCFAAELSAAEERTRRETIAEILNDMPICNDKPSKCYCTDSFHETQNAIIRYLVSLTSKNNDQ